jgi:hypothetical protein
MKATIKTGGCEVTMEGQGQDEVLAIFGAIGVAVGQDGSRVSREVEVFLAAHGFSPSDYQRGNLGAEDVEAFVARRELEQAGVKFTRRAPWQVHELEAALEKICADLGTPRREDTPQPIARCDVRQTHRGRRVDMIVIDDPIRDQDPMAVKDRMNAHPAMPTGCGFYPTPKAEAVTVPAQKRKPGKAAPKAGKRGSK